MLTNNSLATEGVFQTSVHKLEYHRNNYFNYPLVLSALVWLLLFLDVCSCSTPLYTLVTFTFISIFGVPLLLSYVGPTYI